MVKDVSSDDDGPSPRSVLDNGDGWCSDDVDDAAASSPASSSKEWTSASTEVTSNTNPNNAPPPPALPIPLHSRPPVMEDIPGLLHTMMTERGVESAAATKRMYELCDVGHKHNRVPMVCGGRYDVLGPLAWCLTQDSGEPHRRNLACLSLSNLSIPTENKHVMALGPASNGIIGGLCRVLAENTPESYLCCICLMNLSFLRASIITLLQHSPVPDGCPPLSPLDNPHSLLRILERLLLNNDSANDAPNNPKCVRWACGLIKNLAKSAENAALFGRTDIPRCIFGNVRNASSPPVQWTSNSLEEFSFSAALNLSQWPMSRRALYTTTTIANRFYSPPEVGGERSRLPSVAVHDMGFGAAADGVNDPESFDDTSRCVIEEEDSSSIETYRTGTSTRNSFFGSSRRRRSDEKEYLSDDSSDDRSVDVDVIEGGGVRANESVHVFESGGTRANNTTFNKLPFRFPFNELPRNITTQSILYYVDGIDWLNFRAVSRGCYQFGVR